MAPISVGGRTGSDWGKISGLNRSQKMVLAVSFSFPEEAIDEVNVLDSGSNTRSIFSHG